MQQTPIVISGSIAIDRIMSFGGKYQDVIDPEHLNSLSISVFVDSLKDVHGGVAANIAYSLALLGDEPFLLGSVGHDATAYMEELARAGVNITHLHESDLPTASFNEITDSDLNQVGGFYPGAMFDSSTLSLKPWKDQSPIVVVSPHDPKAMKSQVQEAKEWGLRLCYDIGQQVSNMTGEDMLAGVEAAELLILNEYELGVLSKKIGIDVATIKTTVPIVITTLGKKGSVIEGSRVGKPIVIGVAQPTRVSDPTGAGDAFRSGFLYGFVRRWPLEDAAQLGAVVSSFALESVGTQTHHFTLEDIRVRYKEAFGKTITL